MRRLDFAVLGVSEIRWTETGKVALTTEDPYSLSSGLVADDASHEQGVTLILSKDTGKRSKEWEAISACVREHPMIPSPRSNH